jgi:GTP pyrophosphokinase
MDSVATLRNKNKRRRFPAVEKLRPFLDRQGLREICEALEEGFFFLTHPLLYHRIVRARGRHAREILAIDQVVVWLDAKLAEHQIEARFDGRLKRISSIYRKIQRRGLSLDEIHDLRGLRIIVPDRATCYQALDLVHESYDPVPDQQDDYIVNPKSNGYRSLHTVVTDDRGKSFEVQIRTPAMHQVAEQGSAAHWRYKDTGPIPEPATASPSSPLRTMPRELRTKEAETR